MADVYLAEHTFIPNLQVAIKVPKSELLSPQLLGRFRLEANALVKLVHPAIVRIRHYDERADGRPYLVMDYMPGGTLADRLDEQTRLSLKEALPNVERVAEALAYAHSQGVLHRDVKPANILFDKDGRAYLSDFGIAKVIHEAGDTTYLNLTGSGGIPGTPAYVSPEQMRNEPFDHRIDVYALGVVVFEMLAGGVPYKASSSALQASMHVTAPIPSLRERQPELPERVDAIITRALAKEPDERYQTAGELAAALRAVVYPPIPEPEAEPQPDTEQKADEKKVDNSSHATYGWLIIIGIILVIALIIGGVFYVRGRGESPEPTLLPPAVETMIMTPEPGDTATPSPTHEPTNTSPASSTVTTVPGEIIHIVQPGENIFRIGLRYGFTYQELATYNGLSNPDSLTVGQQIRIPPRSISIRTTRTTPATPTPAPTLTQTPTLTPPPTPIGLAAAPIALENASQIEPLAMWDQDGVIEVAFSPDGNQIVAGSPTGIYLYDAVTLNQTSYTELIRPDLTTEEPDGGIRDLAFDANLETITSAAWKGNIRLWRVTDGTLLNTIVIDGGGVTSVGFSPDGQTIASGSDDKISRIWRVTDSALLAAIQEPVERVFGITFSPDGNLLAIGELDILLWNIEDGQLVNTLEGHTSYVEDIVFNHDGQILASGGWDNTIRLWRVSDGTLLDTIIGHSDIIWSLAFAPDDQILASASSDGTILLWSVNEGHLLAALREHKGGVKSIAFSPDGHMLASASSDGTVRLWGIPTEGGLRP